MSGTFTVPLKRVIELTGGTTDIVDGVTKMTGGNIGISHYPIFDEAYRARLDGLIIDHYWNQEIGLESVDMFQMAMRRKLNEIMPQYNLLYLSQRMAFDPLKTVDIRVVYSSDSTQNSTGVNTAVQDATTTGNNTQNTSNAGESNTESDSSSKSRVVASETPQSFLSGNGDYATSANDVNGTTNTGSTGAENSTSDVVASNTDVSNSNANSTSTGTDTQNRNDDTQTSGYQGVPADLIMRYRESLINIDLMVLADLAELFMMIWNNGDEYSHRNNNRDWYY